MMKPAARSRLVSELASLDDDDFAEVLIRTRESRRTPSLQKTPTTVLRCAKDHWQECCQRCGTHANPHRGCLLR